MYIYLCPECDERLPLEKRATPDLRHCPQCGHPITTEEIDRQVAEREEQLPEADEEERREERKERSKKKQQFKKALKREQKFDQKAERYHTDMLNWVEKRRNWSRLFPWLAILVILGLTLAFRSCNALLLHLK